MANACAFDGCGRRVTRDGLCGPHSMQQSKGDALYPIGDHTVRLAKRYAGKQRSQELCSYPGCGRKYYTMGVCRPHRGQLLRGEELAPIGTTEARSAAQTKSVGCQFPGCDRPHGSLGLCGSHYMQMRGGGGLHPIGDGPIRPKPNSTWWALSEEARAALLEGVGRPARVRTAEYRAIRSEVAKRRWAEGQAAPKDARICVGC